MPRGADDAVRKYAWEEPKRGTESPRAAGALLEAHVRAGEAMREREALLREAVAEAESAGDPARLYQSHHRLGLHFEVEGALEKAEHSMREAVAACEGDHALSRERAAALNDRGVVLARLGRADEAMDGFVTAAAAAGEDEHEAVAQSARQNQGLLTWIGGDSAAALDLWDAAFRGARERDDAIANAQVLNNIAVVRLLEGADDEAQKFLNRAVLLAQRGGDVRGLAFAYNNLGLIFSGPERGDHVAAIPFVEMALALLAGTIDVLARLYVLNNNILVFENAHLEPARRFRTQFSETLRAFSFAYPSRSADVEQIPFLTDGSDSTDDSAVDQEWEISEHLALLLSCSRCGPPE